MEKKSRKKIDRRKRSEDRRRANLGAGPSGVDRRKNPGDRRKILGDRRKGWKEEGAPEPKEYKVNIRPGETLEDLLKRLKSEKRLPSD